MIELQNISFSYGEKPVLRDVSAVLEDGRVTAVLGKNGCGKSTLLELIVGLHRAEGGSLLIDGQKAESLSPHERALHVAYMAQNRPVPHILARRMVLHGRFPHLSYPRKYRKLDYELADEALREAGAEELAQTPMTEMSGGQRQKIYLAMALAQGTQNLLLDEPTSFLDVGHQAELLRLAGRLAGQGRAVVMVLHDLRAALENADALLVLEDGRKAASGTPEKLYASGLLDSLFGVKLRRLDTPAGPRYYYE